MTTTRSDVLYGIEAIALYTGLTKRQALHQHEKHRLPTFKMGRTVCPTRSGLANHFRQLQEAASGERL